MGLNKNAQTLDEEIDLEHQQFIQHITKDEGERGCVEQAKFNDVLQIGQQVDLMCFFTRPKDDVLFHAR